MVQSTKGGYCNCCPISRYLGGAIDWCISRRRDALGVAVKHQNVSWWYSGLSRICPFFGWFGPNSIREGCNPKDRRIGYQGVQVY